VSVYFDASVIASFLIDDPVAIGRRPHQSRGPVAVVSDFAVAEVASALNLRVRAGSMARDDACLALVSIAATGANGRTDSRHRSYTTWWDAIKYQERPPPDLDEVTTHLHS
jgi:hypothetical protein